VLDEPELGDSGSRVVASNEKDLTLHCFYLIRSFVRIFSTNLYMDPAFDATSGCHAMNQINAGLRLYIRPLGGPHMCPGLDERRARSPHSHNGLVWADNLSRV